MDIKKIMDLMSQAKTMQEEMQTKMKSQTVRGSALADMVTVDMNGQYEVSKITIDPELIQKNEHEFVQEVIRSAVNDAVAKARDIGAGQIKSMASLLGL